MNPESIDIKAKKLLGQFESMPDIELSSDWNDTLNRKLRLRMRQGKGAPFLPIMVAIIILVNGGFIFGILVQDKPARTENSQQLQIIARDILFNPDSANY
jgi:hypothetical protein